MFKKRNLIEQNLKKSFQNVKSDVNSLKNQLNEQNKLISQILELMAESAKKAEISPQHTQKAHETQVPQEIMGSNQSINQSITNQSITLTSQFHTDINRIFSNLPKKQFLTFLKLYELNEKNELVTYYDLSKSLNLSEDCIRGYISALIKQGAPILKKRSNTNITYLSILDDFKTLKLKGKLEDLYYTRDPSQKKLFDKY